MGSPARRRDARAIPKLPAPTKESDLFLRDRSIMRITTASIAINATLALALVGFIAYSSQAGNLGSTLAARTAMRAPTTFRMAQNLGQRQVSVGAKKLREAVADEYGRGLAQMASEEKVVDKIQNDLKVWMEVFKTEPQVRDFMFDPLSNVNEKAALVKDVVEKAGMQEYTNNFLNLLLDMGRFDQLEEIAQVFDEEIMEMQGTKQVRVRSAIELDDDAMFKIDEDLLAGFVIEMDSQQIDMSLKTELDQIKAEL